MSLCSSQPAPALLEEQSGKRILGAGTLIRGENTIVLITYLKMCQMHHLKTFDSLKKIKKTSSFLFCKCTLVKQQTHLFVLFHVDTLQLAESH